MERDEMASPANMLQRNLQKNDFCVPNVRALVLSPSLFLTVCTNVCVQKCIGICYGIITDNIA